MRRGRQSGECGCPSAATLRTLSRSWGRRSPPSREPHGNDGDGRVTSYDGTGRFLGCPQPLVPSLMTAHAPFDTVIFDLDGTVSDSAPGILASLDHAFHDTGDPPPDALVRFIGPPFETAFRAEGFTPDEIKILMAS